MEHDDLRTVIFRQPGCELDGSLAGLGGIGCHQYPLEHGGSPPSRDQSPRREGSRRGTFGSPWAGPLTRAGTDVADQDVIVSRATPHPMTDHDAFSPNEIAGLVETRGVAKANAPTFTTFVLGVVAGAFIALGAVLSTTVATGSSLGYGPTRWLAGVAFSLGLILVVVAGAELFTGNNLIVMSVVARHVPLGRLLRNWAIVYVGNALGAL